MLASIVGTEISSDLLQYTYWALAISGTLIFVGLTVLSFMGGDVEPSDVDVDGDGFVDHVDTGNAFMKFFSVKAITAFAMFFGWSGILFGNTLLGVIAALAIGLFMMFLTGYIMKLLLKLQDPGAGLSLDTFVGCRGTVYMRIPAGREQAGKVTLATPNAGTREVNAMADVELSTGTLIVVRERLEGNCFLVEKI